MATFVARERAALCRGRALILLTIGTQLPFDRLVRTMDAIAPSLDLPVFAQTGESQYVPQNLTWARHLPPIEFQKKARSSKLIVSHAGIGSVLTAMRLERPVILFPRELRFGEHRTDHQLATCDALRGRRGVYIARTEEELGQLLRAEALEPSSLADSQIAIAGFVANLSSSIDRLLRDEGSSSAR
jgi:UDP-N-acetylglucosamine transferase subunit ALG13